MKKKEHERAVKESEHNHLWIYAKIAFKNAKAEALGKKIEEQQLADEMRILEEAELKEKERLEYEEKLN